MVASASGGRPAPSIKVPPTTATTVFVCANPLAEPKRIKKKTKTFVHRKLVAMTIGPPLSTLIELIDIAALIQLLEIVEIEELFRFEFLHQWIARAHDVERRPDGIHVRIGFSAHLMLRVFLVGEVDHIAVFGAQQI